MRKWYFFGIYISGEEPIPDRKFVTKDNIKKQQIENEPHFAKDTPGYLRKAAN